MQAPSHCLQPHSPDNGSASGQKRPSGPLLDAHMSSHPQADLGASINDAALLARTAWRMCSWRCSIRRPGAPRAAADQCVPMAAAREQPGTSWRMLLPPAWPRALRPAPTGAKPLTATGKMLNSDVSAPTQPEPACCHAMSLLDHAVASAHCSIC